MNKTLSINLSDEFYYSEERCGYYVSEEMKKIWSIELDLLKKFSDVCEKNNLNYFMDGGTLLGAVRHKGFIPWDDDADVIMPREDYNKLFKIASQEFQYPYFFQNTLTEDGFFRTHAQLRNSETTGFIQIDGEKNINKGIFIDIFVLDGIADNFIFRYLHRKEIETKKKILAYEYDRIYNELTIKGKVIYKLIHCFFRIYPFKKFFTHFNLKVLARYSGKKTKMVGDITLKWRKNVQWPRGWYEGYFYLPFENIQLRAPLFYKDVLGRQYGDYMKIPGDVTAANGRVHGDITFDPEVPYQDYCINHQDVVMRIGEKL